MTLALLVGLYTFALSLVSVWFIRWVAYQRAWVALPRTDRWHTRSIALFGGVGIFLSFFFTGIGLFFAFGIQEHILLPLAFFGGAIFIFAVGLADDILHFKPSTKLIGEIIAAATPITFGLVLSITPWTIVNLMITFVWFIAIINAVNIIDNMDGLAAGIVMIATATLLVVQATTKGFFPETFSFLMTTALFASVAGFWFFNRYPASIFMGDAGSLFLGYTLAALSIPSFMNGFFGISSVFLALLLPATILLFPIFDAVFVTILRFMSGRSPFHGGRDHSSHRLVGLGFSEQQAVRILCGLTLVGGGVAIALHIFSDLTTLFVLLYTLFLVFAGIYLGRVKVYPEPEDTRSTARWTPLVTQFFYKRQAAEVLLDFILIAGSYYLSYFLRFENTMDAYGQTTLYLQSLPIMIASCLLGFYIGGVYRGIWHFVTIADIQRYTKGILIGIGIGILSIAVLYRLQGYSRSVFIIFGVLLFLFVVGSRLCFRIFDDMVQKKTARSKTTNVLIYGAGQGGKLLYEECARNPLYRNCRVLAFIDDDATKQHLSIVGVPIYSREEISAMAYEHDWHVHELWTSSAKIPREKIYTFADDFKKIRARDLQVRKFTLTIEEFGQ